MINRWFNFMGKFLHGLARRRNRHPLFSRWCAMRARCQNPNNPNYKRYGGRGISVCARWLKFSNFLSDMESTFRNGLTLERKNNNGSYHPKNCVWANSKAQGSNMRTNRGITAFGITLCLSAWARRIGITPGLLHYRLRSGWRIERALSSKRFNRWDPK